MTKVILKIKKWLINELPERIVEKIFKVKRLKMAFDYEESLRRVESYFDSDEFSVEMLERQYALSENNILKNKREAQRRMESINNLFTVLSILVSSLAGFFITDIFSKVFDIFNNVKKEFLEKGIVITDELANEIQRIEDLTLFSITIITMLVLYLFIQVCFIPFYSEREMNKRNVFELECKNIELEIIKKVIKDKISKLRTNY